MSLRNKVLWGIVLVITGIGPFILARISPKGWTDLNVAVAAVAFLLVVIGLILELKGTSRRLTLLTSAGGLLLFLGISSLRAWLSGYFWNWCPFLGIGMLIALLFLRQAFRESA